MASLVQSCLYLKGTGHIIIKTKLLFGIMCSCLQSYKIILKAVRIRKNIKVKFLNYSVWNYTVLESKKLIYAAKYLLIYKIISIGLL